MSRTAAEQAVMQQTAARFEQVDEALQSMLGGLVQRLDSLQSAWRGAGGRSFEQVKSAWAQDQAALHQALRETATAIRTAGAQYHAADVAAADRVSATARRIELPL
ncbi:WXG100 family type VII secretion target [Solwaraspora sp. WMMD406]|uniref:WXG100 family type VII secretion target n=1 Tax=Solwaraspora sp. WMMD406 TaxID=3016095 RepID=UPI00241782A5|nr:WXG100 family type VII secretion target [Solwaraspora sp. WMMD406]MDG4763367.1 WXG100 family type VII secretion target [Solwaraspora sp. WMMD406]